MFRAPACASPAASARSLSTSTISAGAPGPNARSSASRLLPWPEMATAIRIVMAGEGNGSQESGARSQEAPVSSFERSEGLPQKAQVQLSRPRLSTPDFLQNEFHGSGQIHCLCKGACLFLAGLLRSSAGQHEDTATTQRPRRQHIAQAVSYPPAVAQVDPELLRGLAVEQYAWLPAVAGTGQL